jgi:hypothetical protein
MLALYTRIESTCPAKLRIDRISIIKPIKKLFIT